MTKEVSASGVDGGGGTMTTSLPIAYSQMNDAQYPGCMQANTKAFGTGKPILQVDPGSTAPTAPGVSASVASVTQALKVTDEPVVAAVSAAANNDDGKQITSIANAKDLSTTGANQAATVGAIFCVEGANANLTNVTDASAYYASCKQNFSAANGLNPSGAFTPEVSVLNSEVAKQAFDDFEKNFGVSRDDYLSRMLGSGGGTGALFDMVSGKIGDAKLQAAMDGASKLPADSSVAGDPGRYAVNLGGGAKKPAENAMKKSLKQSLGEAALDASRRPASEFWGAKKVAPAAEKYEGLTPESGGIFASSDDLQELTIFDVVLNRYSEIRKRWRQ